MSSTSPSTDQVAAAREPLSPGHFYLRMTSLFALVLLVGTGAGIWIGRSTASPEPSQGDDFAALDMDAAASADERAERALWDRTTQDGLADEPSLEPSRR